MAVPGRIGVCGMCGELRRLEGGRWVSEYNHSITKKKRRKKVQKPKQKAGGVQKPKSPLQQIHPIQTKREKIHNENPKTGCSSKVYTVPSLLSEVLRSKSTVSKFQKQMENRHWETHPEPREIMEQDENRWTCRSEDWTVTDMWLCSLQSH